MSLRNQMFLLYLAVITISSWLCDDAYITFRTVDNLLNGYGATWNTFERVQAYTHPLMMFSMTALSFFTREVYFTAIFFNIITSALAVYILLFRLAKDDTSALVVGFLLMTSRSFVEFSTSGLENSLSFFLMSMFYIYHFKHNNDAGPKNIFVMTLIFSLLLVNRMDAILLVFPVLMGAYVESCRQNKTGLALLFKNAFLGLLPFLLWEIFSIIYYGFPFPNTAYAKLNTGIPSIEYFARGCWYFVATFLLDPATMMVFFLVSGYLFLHRKGNNVSLPLLGVVLYLAYILKVGGDFMSGRFFTVPFFIMMILLSRLDLSFIRAATAVKATTTCILLLCLLTANIYGLMQGEPFGLMGVAHESSYYFKKTSLILNTYRVLSGETIDADLIKKVSRTKSSRRPELLKTEPIVSRNTGFCGYHCGPQCRIIDEYALSDALLARIPPDYFPKWRVGHIVREVPAGYLESVANGQNRMTRPEMAELYDDIKAITQDEIWSVDRWRVIVKMNLGI